MSHPEQREFFRLCRDAHPRLFNGVSVLEVGSLDINGTIRDLFTSDYYIGVDIAEGPGVDVVAQGQSLNYCDGYFDVAVSAECFEHNPYWLATFRNMCRMASRAVMFTCATTGRGEHGTARTSPANSPLTVAAGWDYYRNLTARDFTAALDLDDLFGWWEFTTNESSHDLYFIGLKEA